MRKYIIWFIVLVVVVAVIGGLANGVLIPRSVVKTKVAETAQRYIAEMGMIYIGGSGPGMDKDGDGYVSIDVNVRTNPADGSQGVEKRMNLECEWTLFPSFIPTGCKEKVVIRTDQ